MAGTARRGTRAGRHRFLGGGHPRRARRPARWCSRRPPTRRPPTCSSSRRASGAVRPRRTRARCANWKRSARSCSSCLPVSARGIRSSRGPPSTVCRCGATSNWPGGCATRPAPRPPGSRSPAPTARPPPCSSPPPCSPRQASGLPPAGTSGCPSSTPSATRAGFDALVVELSSFQLHYTEQHRPARERVPQRRGRPPRLARLGAGLPGGEGEGVQRHGGGVPVQPGRRRHPDDGGRRRRGRRLSGRRVRPRHSRAGDVGVVDGILCDRAFHATTGVRAVELIHVDELAASGLDSPHMIAERARGIRVGAQPGNAGRRDPQLARRVPDRPPPHRARGRQGRHPLGGRLEGHQPARRPRRARPSFPRVVWIVGGLLKGVDVNQLVQSEAGRLRAAVVIGVDRARCSRHSRDTRRRSRCSRSTPLDTDQVMPTAVRLSAAVARSGDTVLLGPGGRIDGPVQELRRPRGEIRGGCERDVGRWGG